ncbi:hypothetical protein HanXRQr2_Chr17g0828751 [Helianthus annuus]|uniref:Uncharacterized protein n=1 Tax=Helianthus annuus TaxID=4232 RepID=A0A251RUM1_HELAN|nr:hypothetical protein HanXRQr2_Chr17g0828751 [Helianthus annuus]KAJ0436045.1 hypothetical protein HanIR_Chr17g0900091 [Helianthus annuus]
MTMTLPFRFDDDSLLCNDDEKVVMADKPAMAGEDSGSRQRRRSRRWCFFSQRSYVGSRSHAGKLRRRRTGGGARTSTTVSGGDYV